MAAGRTRPATLMSLTATILAVMRQVTKIVAITTNNGEYRTSFFIFGADKSEASNPTSVAEEKEHSNNKTNSDTRDDTKGKRAVLEGQLYIHPIHT